jgi:hypothetical protein
MMTTILQNATFHARRLFAALLMVLMFVRPVTMLAAGLPAPPVPDPQPQLLQIEILDGEGALNNIRQRTAREPIVEVKDENHKPVAGALILFAIQSNGGAGASFDGATTLSVTTDAAGRAVAHGLTPNNKSGDFTIKVTATLGAITTFVIIHQKNVKGAKLPKNQQQSDATNSTGPPDHGIRNRIIKWTAVGSAIVVGTVLAVVLTRSNGTSITAGPGNVGAP